MAINNVEELRDFIAKELERVSQGDITPASANASANLAGKMLQSVKMELEYNKMVGANPNIGFLGKNSKKELEKLSHDPNTGEIKKAK
jgi:hypothetical protein